MTMISKFCHLSHWGIAVWLLIGLSQCCVGASAGNETTLTSPTLMRISYYNTVSSYASYVALEALALAPLPDNVVRVASVSTSFGKHVNGVDVSTTEVFQKLNRRFLSTDLESFDKLTAKWKSYQVEVDDGGSLVVLYRLKTEVRCLVFDNPPLWFKDLPPPGDRLSNYTHGDAHVYDVLVFAYDVSSILAEARTHGTMPKSNNAR